MLWGSIAAEATAALGHTSKGKSGGVNGRGYPSLAFRRHQWRARHEPLVQHQQRGKRALGYGRDTADRPRPRPHVADVVAEQQRLQPEARRAEILEGVFPRPGEI